MTYLDLITAAYRLRNVIDENESPSAEQGVAALTTLNQMMAEWEADGVILQYIPIAASDLSADLMIPDYAHSGVTAGLAIRVAAGGAITPELQSQADMGYGTIVRRAVSASLPPANMDHVPAGEASGTRFSILNG